MADLYDISALLALFDEQHWKHNSVKGWFDRYNEQGWLSCPLTQNGFLRVISQPSYPRTVGLAEAYERLLEVTTSRHHQFTADDISLLDDTLVEFRDLAGPRQLTDVYLLALAVTHGARLVTLDARISLDAVRGANTSHLVVL